LQAHRILRRPPRDGGARPKIRARRVACYGLGRFPGALYKTQWTTLLDMADDIRAFIRPNQTSRNTKS